MKSVIYFCLFFWMAPFFLAWVMKIRQILAGPESDSAYDQEQYRLRLRRSVIELIVYTLLMLAGVAVAIYAGYRLTGQ